ncbi:hypothetical protein CPB84DRAFT_1844075 [Gymnopilus junonius]|uniref:Uncharacterized protein n=1 Tax=Gymnopilus junonius TaxID=109634 RepID=A0A9P5TQ91_GYMJU|nr:hypothetical protein CPB84DRAFT_1844075 [Gymnopilus junonius]
MATDTKNAMEQEMAALRMKVNQMMDAWEAKLRQFVHSEEEFNKNKKALYRDMLQDTQSSLSLHLDKVRALESVLVEHEGMKHNVLMLREMMEERMRELQVPATIQRKKTKTTGHKVQLSASVSPLVR